jgi:cellulose synthase/poly-beta-1,6-N-acetylglucosamine synthase-like glycosyltransferase
VKISIVVPAFNEERLLPQSLAAISAASSAFAAAGWTTELIVCDNNSTDRTAEIAAAAGAIVVFEPINQIGRARNAGAFRATGDWLLFVDADSFPTLELFTDVVTAIGSGTCVAGGSTVRVDLEGFAYGAVIGWWNVLSRTFEWGAGSFIFCETAVFREIGGFTERLYAAEEIDLFRRLKRLARGRRRSIVILHRHPLLTSARKAHLYTVPEMLRFWGRTLLSGGRTFRNRDGAFPWYDGRR